MDHRQRRASISSGGVERSVSRRPATRREHRRFCEIEGWTLVRDARGKSVRHHLTYELPLADGTVLRTRISRPANHDQYGPGLWSHILSTQLAVTAAQFWECLRSGQAPDRPGSSRPEGREPIPAQVAYHLLHTVGLSDDEVAGLTREQAVARLNEYWTTQT
jgi:hypothetical protein